MIASIGLTASSFATPLRVHPANPLYFVDGSGRAVYLGGHQIFVDLQDHTFNNPVPYGRSALLDWTWYMQFMRSRNLNFIRNWTELSTGSACSGCPPTTPMPYRRVSGHGTASDGGLKFDLNQFDQGFFDRMRSRVIDAGNNGVYISIMLFDVYAFSSFGTPDSLWLGNVFNTANNMNGVHADSNGDGWGVEFFTGPDSRIRDLQKAYVRKVIDTLNDLNNVIFEIANEAGALSWQYDMVNYVKTYESTKPQQHLVYFSPGGLDGPGTYMNMSRADLLNSAADMYSVALSWGNFVNDPPANDTSKPAVFDRDHVDAVAGPRPMLPWKALTRGYHFNLYDQPFENPSIESSEWELARRNIGATVRYANEKFANLARMRPRGDLSTTGYALADPGSEYLIFQPARESIGVKLISGTYSFEWFDPNSLTVANTGTATVPDGSTNFSPPSAIAGESVLYLKATSREEPSDTVAPLVTIVSPINGASVPR